MPILKLDPHTDYNRYKTGEGYAHVRGFCVISEDENTTRSFQLDNFECCRYTPELPYGEVGTFGEWMPVPSWVRKALAEVLKN